MATFRMESRLPDGTYLGTLPFSNFQGEFYRAKRSQCRFDVPLRHPAITRTTINPAKSEVWLYRNSTLIYAGPLWDVDVSSSGNKLSCTSEGLESYFDMRRISASKAFNASRALVAWNLIAQSQAETNGNLYITSNTLPSTPAIAISYDGLDGKVISEAIDDLAKELGFDWVIRPDRKFTVVYPRAQTQSNIQLNYPGNMTSYSIQITGKFVQNDILVKGSDKVFNRVADTTSRTTYGLRQSTMTDTSLTTLAQVVAYCNQAIALHKKPKFYPQVQATAELVNPYNGDLWYGSIVKTTINDGWSQFNQNMIVNGWQLTIGKQFNESYSFYLNDLREDNLDGSDDA